MNNTITIDKRLPATLPKTVNACGTLPICYTNISIFFKNCVIIYEHILYKQRYSERQMFASNIVVNIPFDDRSLNVVPTVKIDEMFSNPFRNVLGLFCATIE